MPSAAGMPTRLPGERNFSPGAPLAAAGVATPGAAAQGHKKSARLQSPPANLRLAICLFSTEQTHVGQRLECQLIQCWQQTVSAEGQRMQRFQCLEGPGAIPLRVATQHTDAALVIDQAHEA